MVERLPRVLREFGIALAMHYPTMDYPQDLIDSLVMPALRRSYDKARRENWKLAKNTTADFKFMTGPVMPDIEHVNGDPCSALYNDDWEESGPCPGCEAHIPTLIKGYNHQFGWYASFEEIIHDEEQEEVSRIALHNES